MVPGGDASTKDTPAGETGGRGIWRLVPVPDLVSALLLPSAGLACLHGLGLGARHLEPRARMGSRSGLLGSAQPLHVDRSPLAPPSPRLHPSPRADPEGSTGGAVKGALPLASPIARPRRGA